MMHLSPAVCAALLAAAVLPACSTSSGGSAASESPPSRPSTSAATTRHSPAPSASSARTHSARPSRTSAPQSRPPAGSVDGVLAQMSLQQQVGQLFMVDCPTSGVSSATLSALEDQHVGSVILDGTSTSGRAAIRSITGELQSHASGRVRLFVATDQEGGQVQRLQGPGFTRIPSAVAQSSWAPKRIQTFTAAWAGELREAGVNVDLAPVLDTVPPDQGSNPPIGDLDREYGHTVDQVSRNGLAVARGLSLAGVDPTVKHFPGLGRVHANTDLSSGVTDPVTTPDDPYLIPFRTAVKAGVPFVMMSTTIYPRLDPSNVAAFSPKIVSGLLRGALGFQGVVITDDIGAAKQVADIPPAQRATKFIAAGGTMLLTVDASIVPAMADGLIEKAKADPAFAKLVTAAARTVLVTKAKQGLLG